MTDRHSVSTADREHNVNAVETWTAESSRSLGVTPKAIEACVRRGWLYERIEAASDVRKMHFSPPAWDCRRAGKDAHT